MAGKLDTEEVRRWLRGQKVAERTIEQERAKSLRERSHEESLRIYLDLKAMAPDRPDRGPSPMLMAVRRVLDRYAKQKGGSDETDQSGG